MISIITPTHCFTPYLYELYESIKGQSYKDWEWILFLNGNLTNKNAIQEIKEDKRVKIFRDELTTDKIKIGDIKHKAFSCGKGDILVEADHDDLLTVDCLEEINKAFKDKKVGMVYSDTAFIGLNKPFDSEYGWESYKYSHNGKDLIAMSSFEPSKEMIQSMWFSPNHVRAWRRSVYEELGGHDKTMLVADDLDLTIRTYLKHKIKRIPKTLYIYRFTGQNSYIKYGSQIQFEVKNLQNKYKRELNDL